MSLSTTITSLTTIRDSRATELAGLANMGPNFGLDGVSIDNVAYASALRQEIDELTKLINRLSGPCIITHQGR